MGANQSLFLLCANKYKHVSVLLTMWNPRDNVLTTSCPNSSGTFERERCESRARLAVSRDCWCQHLEQLPWIPEHQPTLPLMLQPCEIRRWSWLDRAGTWL